MASQRYFLNGPYQISEGILLPFKNIRGSLGLPKRLEIVLEQAADTPQFRNGGQIGISGNSASKKNAAACIPTGIVQRFPPAQQGAFFLRRSLGERSGYWRHTCRPPSCLFCLSCLLPLECEKRSAEHSGSPEGVAFWQDGSCVIQLPSCHEEPVSWSGQIAYMEKFCVYFL